MKLHPFVQPAAFLLLLFWGASRSEPETQQNLIPISSKETLQYGVEWRLIRAGQARISFDPITIDSKPVYDVRLRLESTGMVSKLYKVDDNYMARSSGQLCAENIVLNAEEGKRKRETKVTVDRAQGKIHYLERDLVNNTTVAAKEMEVPPCVHEIIAGLYRARMLKLEPGQSATIPITDGKKVANVKVEAQEREQVSTPTGNHKTIRYEAYIFNGALYAKSARCLIWMTDDARRTPVQIQVRMRLLIGTITLTLEKEERG
jgi:hypothetical protein